MDKIYSEDKMHIGSKATSEAINIFFSNKVKKLIEKIPKNVENPMKDYMKAIKTPIQLMNFREIDLNQLKSIVKAMKTSNAAGNDDITSKMIKNVNESILPLILHLVNTTIKEKKFPDITKISKIIPHWKNSNYNTNPMNLRPINLMTIISKIIERVLVQQMLRYLIE